MNENGCDRILNIASLTLSVVGLIDMPLKEARLFPLTVPPIIRIYLLEIVASGEWSVSIKKVFLTTIHCPLNTVLTVSCRYTHNLYRDEAVAGAVKF